VGGWGWVGGGGGVGGWEEKLRIRLNSAQFELNLPVGAELGKSKTLEIKATLA
jgi:hypothetical protein